MFGLTGIKLYIIVAGLAVVLIGGAFLYAFQKGETAGSGAVTSAVQSKTIETLDAARKAKEKADADVRETPYSGRVDSLK